MGETTDWYRATTWDEQTAAAFEARLARARAAGRPQYVRIQASHLLESPDGPTREAGRGLLLRVVEDYPDELQAKTAAEQLGMSLVADGRLDEGIGWLRETLRRCAESPIGDSGTSGVVELQLAEALLATGDPTHLDEALGLLGTAEEKVGEQAFLRDRVYRYLLAAARAQDLRGDPVAGRLAREALAVAAETRPALPRHPDVGRPRATPAELRELERIADGG